MNKKIAFTSQSLQEINLEAEWVISTHLQDLDRISNDIKSLEQQLESSGIHFTFYFVLSTEERRFKRIQGMSYDLIQSEIAEQTDHCQVWGKCDENKSRLSYNIYFNLFY